MDIPRLTQKLDAFLFTQKFAPHMEELNPVCHHAFLYILFNNTNFTYRILRLYLKPALN